MLYDHHHGLIPEHFPLEGSAIPFKQSLSISSSPEPKTTLLLSVPVDIPILDISYQRNHTLCGLLYLASFTYHEFSRSIHVVAGVCTLFLFIAE